MYDKIVFLVSSLSQPRAIRRVESIAALGYEVEVYGYDRVRARGYLHFDSIRPHRYRTYLHGA